MYRYYAETQLYYLQSRYYNPEWDRFINADTIIGDNGALISHNMFAYCLNNAVNNQDPDGTFLIPIFRFAISKIIIKVASKTAKKTVINSAKTITNGPVKSAYDIAKDGGKYSGFYKQYINKSIKEIEKGMQSIKKEIETH